MSKLNPSVTATSIKIFIMLIALVGVFWAMARLKAGALNPVTNQLIGQSPDVQPERKARVQFGQDTVPVQPSAAETKPENQALPDQH